jgi:uncharacterized glyoxalase superfamily protein PhnB
MTEPNIIPALTYVDPRAALAWLEAAFGFELVMLIEDDTGNVAHSEMKLGASRIMVGAEWSVPFRSPRSVGGVNTQCLHIAIDTDVDAHCAKVRAAGADVIAEPEDQFYGHRTYRCRDLEGHVWTIAQPVRDVSREDAEKASGLKITGWD